MSKHLMFRVKAFLANLVAANDDIRIPANDDRVYLEMGMTHNQALVSGEGFARR